MSFPWGTADLLRSCSVSPGDLKIDFEDSQTRVFPRSLGGTSQTIRSPSIYAYYPLQKSCL